MSETRSPYHTGSSIEPQEPFEGTRKDQLERIDNQIRTAEQHLVKLRQAMHQIEQDGMYPVIPTEFWQARNGDSDTQYLYMLFGVNRFGSGYKGPGGKRKLYVGNKPEKIADARRLAENRKTWEYLDRVSRDLHYWIKQQTYTLDQLTQYIDRWPRIDLPAQAGLGIDIAAGRAATVPKSQS